MKVLHVECGRHMYGGPLQVLLLLEGLRAEGVDNILVCPEGSQIAGAQPAAELREIPMGGDIDFGLIFRLRHIIARSRPDIIHLHSRRGADWLGGLASLRSGIPVVLSRRVDNREQPLLAKLKYSLVDQVIAVSQGIRRVLIDAGVSKAKINCVLDAVPESKRHPRDRLWFQNEFSVAADAPLIAVVAQLISRKGHRVMLDALPVLLRDHPGLRVVFFGSGARENAIRARISALDLDDVVLLPGFRKDLARILPCLDLLVHPALTEGLGVSILQASQAGLAVVASRTGGIPEAVIDGVTGLLVPPGDVAALQTAVNSLLNDPSRARQMGLRGADHVAANFSVNKMVAETLAVYRTFHSADRLS